MKTITQEYTDRRLIRPNAIIMMLFGRIILNTIRKFINRAQERGYIDSRSLHSLHALADRALKPTKTDA